MSLIFPAYFVALLGLALPWLLHRFSDHKPDEQLFPSRRFLQETAPPVSRKRRLKYLALLALRVLSLLLLCFLFAQPWLETAKNTGNVHQHHLLAIDRSLSMRADQRWARALQQAQETLAQLPDTDSVDLVSFDQSTSILASSSESRASLHDALSDLRPGYLSADYGLVMQRLNTMAAEQDIPTRLWMITDAQRSALPSQLNALYAPKLSAFELLSVVDRDVFNVHLSAQAQSLDGVNVRVAAQYYTSDTMAENNVSGSDDSSSSNLPQSDWGTAKIVVTHKQQVLASKRVSLLAGRIETVVFDELVLPPGKSPVFQVALLSDQAAEQTLEDALILDNTVSVAVRNASSTPVVLLQSDADVSANAAVFLATALETGGLAEVDQISGTAERVSPEISHMLTARDLSQNRLDPDVLLFVDQGSNALLFNSELAGASGEKNLSARELGVVDESHPLALGDIDWFGTHFYDVTPMALTDNDRVLLMTSEQEPILVERVTARGRLIILNDRLDGISSNLPLQPAFVSLMQSILRYFDASTAIPKVLTVGQRLQLPPNVQVLNAEQEPLLSYDESSQSDSVQINEPGLYTVVSVRGEHRLDVVLDPREADLTVIAGEALRTWQGRYDGGHDKSLTVADGGAAQAVERLNETSQYPLWKLLLPLLILVMMLESWLGNRRLDIRRDGS